MTSPQDVLSVFDKVELRPERFRRGNRVAVLVPCMHPADCLRSEGEHFGSVITGELVRWGGSKWLILNAEEKKAYYLDLKKYSVLLTKDLPDFDPDRFCSSWQFALSRQPATGVRCIGSVLRELTNRFEVERSFTSPQMCFWRCSQCGRLCIGSSSRYAFQKRRYLKESDGEALRRLAGLYWSSCCARG